MIHLQEECNEVYRRNFDKMVLTAQTKFNASYRDYALPTNVLAKEFAEI